MRLYVKDSERKADPEPLETKPRTAILVGLGIWVALLGFFLVVPSAVPVARPWWPWTCVVGIILGLFALFRFRKRR